MSIATNLAKLGLSVGATGVLAVERGGTGTTTGGGSSSPTVTSIVYIGDDTATNIAGGDTVTLNGTNFNAGVNVLIGSTQVNTVTRVSTTQLTFTAPANAAGSYIIYVVNTDGSAAISIPGIQYSGVPAWSTVAGSLGTSTASTSFSTTIAATGDAPVSYAIVSGSLPAGISLNTASGVISGTTPSVASSTTYNFTIRATDVQNQDTNRSFSLTIEPVAVTTSFTVQAVAGGGGSGGGPPGGGGGGGGVLTVANIVVTPSAAYTITVGAGGNSGANGSNSSVIGTGCNVVAIGGGRGASAFGGVANTGGSGGGGAWGGSSYNPGRAGTSGQGNSGGSGAYSSGSAQDMGGGGGGAGGSGSSASGNTAGNGGPGIGGFGGGGGGSASGAYENQGQPFGPGIASTGTGGGAFGQAGGSGRVEIKYSDTYGLAASTTGSPTIGTSGGYRYYIWTTVGTWSITF